MFKLILILVSVVALECRGSVIKNKDYDLFDDQPPTTTPFAWITDESHFTPKPVDIKQYPKGTKTFEIDDRHKDQVDCGEGANIRKKCVNWYLCRNSSIVDDGSFLIDERSDFAQPKFKTCSSMEMCCGPEDVIPGVTVPASSGEIQEEYDEVSTKPSTTVRPSTGRPPTRPPSTVRPTPATKEVPNDDCKTHSGEFIRPTKCGIRNVDGFAGKVKSSNNSDKYAQYGEFPWMMAILTRVVDGNGKKLWKYNSGGSLIRSKVVVTAAHKLFFTDLPNIKVRGGEWNANSNGERCPAHERKVVDALDNDYDGSTGENNIMLLFLDQPFELTAVINTICLPQSEFNFEKSRKLPSVPSCYATGWGAENFGDRKYFQSFLKKVKLPVVPRVTCQNYLNAKKLTGGSLTLTPTMMCAGGEAGNDMCTGDGGSPLVCQNPTELDKDSEMYYLAGIVTSGASKACGEVLIPGIYEDVTKHLKWIKNQLNERGITKDY